MIILFYVMDSLRPDFLSCYGHKRETSPHLDALAKEGVMFRNAFAQSTWTRPSGASMITSTYPSVHGVTSLRGCLPDKMRTVPGLLRQHGFQTIAISAMPNISLAFGFGNGFEHFVEVYKSDEFMGKREMFTLYGDDGLQPASESKQNEVPIVTSQDINECLIPLISKSVQRDLFILAWSVDTHGPYFQRDKDLARFSAPRDKPLGGEDFRVVKGEAELEVFRNVYEDMIYYNDHHFGSLIDVLKDLGLYDDSLIVVTGDHGEAFGEHGFNGHAGVPFDEQIRVPLIMKFPKAQHGGTVIDALVQHIDIGPTILEYIGKKPESNLLQGVSLLPLLDGTEAVNEYVLAEMEDCFNAFHKFAALRTRMYKYVDFFPADNKLSLSAKSIMIRVGRLLRDGRTKRMLFDLLNDPLEKKNMFQKEKSTSSLFGAHIRGILQANKKFNETSDCEQQEKAQLDDETARQLKALGYFE
jgi:arylsulfatase A-like enzyme